jgi:hypothetical protein
VIDRQETYLANMYPGKRTKPPKFRIRGIELEEGWRYWVELHPCPSCNPPFGAEHVSHFIRELIGTIEWCKVHGKFWREFSDRYSHLLSPASTKPVRFPSV